MKENHEKKYLKRLVRECERKGEKVDLARKRRSERESGRMLD